MLKHPWHKQPYAQNCLLLLFVLLRLHAPWFPTADMLSWFQNLVFIKMELITLSVSAPEQLERW